MTLFYKENDLRNGRSGGSMGSTREGESDDSTRGDELNRSSEYVVLD